MQFFLKVILEKTMGSLKQRKKIKTVHPPLPLSLTSGDYNYPNQTESSLSQSKLIFKKCF